jgi:hypothetical protein
VQERLRDEQMGWPGAARRGEVDQPLPVLPLVLAVPPVPAQAAEAPGREAPAHEAARLAQARSGWPAPGPAPSGPGPV